MPLDVKSGQSVRIKISKMIKRQSARKTLERLFMQDKSIVKAINKRSRNFIELPKRRGGQIWTKRPNKVHCSLDRGAEATIKATPQLIRDLNSVADFIEIG